jgi:hypothetical protein
MERVHAAAALDKSNDGAFAAGAGLAALGVGKAAPVLGGLTFGDSIVLLTARWVDVMNA